MRSLRNSGFVGPVMAPRNLPPRLILQLRLPFQYQRLLPLSAVPQRRLSRLSFDGTLVFRILGLTAGYWRQLKGLYKLPLFSLYAPFLTTSSHLQFKWRPLQRQSIVLLRRLSPLPFGGSHW